MIAAQELSFLTIWFSRTSASARLVSKIDDSASRSASAALATRVWCSDSIPQCRLMAGSRAVLTLRACVGLWGAPPSELEGVQLLGLVERPLFEQDPRQAVAGILEPLQRVFVAVDH